ncbi:hypothetical protein Tco_1066014, partial [Tanacetum coccineum]
ARAVERVHRLDRENSEILLMGRSKESIIIFTGYLVTLIEQDPHLRHGMVYAKLHIKSIRHWSYVLLNGWKDERVMLAYGYESNLCIEETKSQLKEMTIKRDGDVGNLEKLLAEEECISGAEIYCKTYCFTF